MQQILLNLANLNLSRALIYSGFLAGLYYLVGYDYGENLDRKYNVLKAELTQEEAKAKETEATLKLKESVQAETAAASEKYFEMTAKLPTEVTAAEALLMVDAIAKTAGVTVKVKEPRPIVRQEFLEEIPLKVAVEGSYSEIMVFYYYLSTLQRITRIGNLSIQPVGASSAMRLRSESQILSYRFAGDSKDGKKEVTR